MRDRPAIPFQLSSPSPLPPTPLPPTPSCWFIVYLRDVAEPAPSVPRCPPASCGKIQVAIVSLAGVDAVQQPLDPTNHRHAGGQVLVPLSRQSAELPHPSISLLISAKRAKSDLKLQSNLHTRLEGQLSPSTNSAQTQANGLCPFLFLSRLRIIKETRRWASSQ